VSVGAQSSLPFGGDAMRCYLIRGPLTAKIIAHIGSGPLHLSVEGVMLLVNITLVWAFWGTDARWRVF